MENQNVWSKFGPQADRAWVEGFADLVFSNSWKLVWSLDQTFRKSPFWSKNWCYFVQKLDVLLFLAVWGAEMEVRVHFTLVLIRLGSPNPPKLLPKFSKFRFSKRLVETEHNSTDRLNRQFYSLPRASGVSGGSLVIHHNVLNALNSPNQSKKHRKFHQCYLNFWMLLGGCSRTGLLRSKKKSDSYKTKVCWPQISRKLFYSQ